MQKSVLDWLDLAACRFGDKTVFQTKENSICFSRLLHQSKAIGSYLCGQIMPRSPVAVLTGRRVDTPACFLGIVQAGCFYAPMDASMPVPRLRQNLEVLQASHMIVDREHLETAAALHFSGHIHVLEDILQTPVQEERLAAIRRAITEEDPLYVIFTSGSSGIPKGVITSHHALMCYIESVQKVLQLSDSDVLGNQSPLDYIAAIRDIYLPLLTGASTVILPKNEFSMPTQLFETLDTYGVTTLCWSVAGLEVPAKLHAFDSVKPHFLKKVIFSGSVMPGHVLRVWQQNLPETVFINQYGPTEATASCTYHVVTETVQDDTVLPIGIPYENYRVVLLNEDGTETPDGQTGEICISGPALALGYYHDPVRTAQSFIPNPLCPQYRSLLYKTGDLGSWNEQGELEFHGRRDRQIKHMGHRIELDEIEKTAGMVAGIEQCCALYQKEKEQLWLFYTGEATSRDIVLHFRQEMPAFMVPRKLMKLSAMPCLPNGKTDMRTLSSYMK